MNFSDFKTKLPPNGDCRAVRSEFLAAVDSNLPGALLKEWRDCGWCGYGEGLIWFEDPALFEDFLKGQQSSGDHTVFARTAFGDLFSVCNDVVYGFMTQYHERRVVSRRFELFGAMVLPNDRFLKDFARITLFKSALKALGPLKHDECYSFVPALALGGEAQVENLRKAKLLEYLDFLSQLN